MKPFTLDELAYRVLPQVAPGRALADSEWRTLRFAAETLLEELPFQLGPERIADNVERFLCEGRSRRAWRCRILLTLLELLPLATQGLPRKCFSHMRGSERRRFFERHVVRGAGPWGLVGKVRYLVLMGAYGDESVPSSMGVLIAGEARPVRRARPRRSLPMVS